MLQRLPYYPLYSSVRSTAGNQLSCWPACALKGWERQVTAAVLPSAALKSTKAVAEEVVIERGLSKGQGLDKMASLVASGAHLTGSLALAGVCRAAQPRQPSLPP